MSFEVLIIAVLILANGVFAMAEIAVVSARKTKLKHGADVGNLRARAPLDLAPSPDRFLAAVQVGISAVGIWVLRARPSKDPVITPEELKVLISRWAGQAAQG